MQKDLLYHFTPYLAHAVFLKMGKPAKKKLVIDNYSSAGKGVTICLSIFVFPSVLIGGGANKYL